VYVSACVCTVFLIKNIIGFNFHAIREKQLKCIEKIVVHSFVDKV
jgi:hypothetical protein